VQVKNADRKWKILRRGMGSRQSVCAYSIAGWFHDEGPDKRQPHDDACCNDGTRPVIFRSEHIDISENDEESEWLAMQNYRNTAVGACTGESNWA